MMQPILQAKRARSLERQAELQRTTGFAGGFSDVGHQVVHELQRRGVPHTYALFAGHLASVDGEFNFQGNNRIAQLMQRSPRTLRRARARLESDKLIASHLLLTGDMLEGQIAPVRRPQVVRDVRPLQRLATIRRGGPGRVAQPVERRPFKPHDRGSTPRAPTAVEVEPPTAELFDELAAKHGEYSGFLGLMAAAQRQRGTSPPAPAQPRAPKPPPNAAPPPDPDELDELDRELAAETERLRRGRDGPD